MSSTSERQYNCAAASIVFLIVGYLMVGVKKISLLASKEDKAETWAIVIGEIGKLLVAIGILLLAIAWLDIRCRSGLDKDNEDKNTDSSSEMPPKQNVVNFAS